MQESKIQNREAYSSNEVAEEEVKVKKAELGELIPEPEKFEKKDISFLSEIYLPIRVELGHSRMRIKEILELGPGSIVKLDKFPDETVELFIGEKELGRGEVVVVGDKLGVKITDLSISEKE